MDKFAEWVAGLGIPGLLLWAAMAASGWAGAVAITTGLSALGPGGMIAGIGVLLVASKIGVGIARWGADHLGKSIVMKMLENGETKEEIWEKVEGAFVSRRYKDRIFRILFDQSE